ncbi:unnamed protein product [Mytilus edulis]|uniref:NTR domain-containing protein n=1 Tax=Mytilus edulis TaxID=6550 RepID=A0A8S3TE42_MYTED|nr:unnamed protein product [Mytilus edulis]
MKLTIVTIVCVVLINFISEAYGCTCIPGTDQERFCSATFVSRGRVTDMKPLKGGEIEYTVAVNYNFKIKVPSTLKVRSNQSSAACGIILDKGVEYLISVIEFPIISSYISSVTCTWERLERTDIEQDTIQIVAGGLGDGRILSPIHNRSS